ncbi:DUF4114 domain-containing protein [Algisphaera agarilytica]|uniref:PEP-CTERM protein-sorting domain-containing protein n=1 Tax=Algisphaera agarilytica TaxID=1385975 RepID=A0A7X0LJ06_9BACT|nr:DUF4114 domain-containing protein [Algisphaera agarilytica]MBB6428279.1 hypothetical protein [Algisphaera agarilytica]
MVIKESLPVVLLLPCLSIISCYAHGSIDEIPIGISQEEVSPELVSTVRRELPERAAVNANFLDPSYSPNLFLSQDAQISVTFLDEGAGFRNSLGYFSYPTGAFDFLTYGDIDLDRRGGISLDELSQVGGVDYGLVFPNSSRLNGGGQLVAGDSVAIADNRVFDAGTEVGFFLLQNAWAGGVVKGYSDDAGDALTFYSLDMLNPENRPEATINTPSNEAYSRHVAMLFAGQERESIIMGFEDLKRTGTNYSPQRAPSDEDFNDAVFLVSSNPIEALFNTQIPTAIQSLSDRPTNLFQVDVCEHSRNAISEYLPERTNVQAEFLNPEYDPNLVVGARTQIAVTFNDEGASYQNSLGYFTYQESTFESLTHGDINLDLTQGVSISELSAIDGVETGMVFAKAAAQGKGGRLLHGDTVLLGDGTEFDPGTRIGFFLVQSGWTGDHVAGFGGDQEDPLVFYTLDMLNPENEANAGLDTDSMLADSRHVAMLFANESRESIVMGIEDLHRTTAELNGYGYASDDDFNDQIFCVWAIQSQALSDTHIFTAPGVIPEPGTAGLAILGLLAGIGGRHRSL